jgi:hypothetical protein
MACVRSKRFAAARLAFRLSSTYLWDACEARAPLVVPQFVFQADSSGRQILELPRKRRSVAGKGDV